MCREEWEDLPMASFLSLKSYFLREDFLDQFYLFFNHLSYHAVFIFL